MKKARLRGLFSLLLVATLVARLAKKLAVLLLRHALAALLDDGSHGTNLDDRKNLRLRPSDVTDKELSYRAGAPLVIFEDVAPGKLGLLHEGFDGLLRHAEGASEAHGRQLTAVNPPVDGHSGDADHLRNLRYREERGAICSAVRHVCCCSLVELHR